MVDGSLVGVVLRGRMSKRKSKSVRVLRPVKDVSMCRKLTHFDPYCGVRRNRYDAPVEIHEPNDFELKVMCAKGKIIKLEDL